MGPDFIWEHNFKMGVRIIGCDGVDWIHLAQDKMYVNISSLLDPNTFLTTLL